MKTCILLALAFTVSVLMTTVAADPSMAAQENIFNYFTNHLDFPARQSKGIVTPEVINGTDASAGDFPYYTALFTQENNFMCGGSLISSEYVLTAAQCVDEQLIQTQISYVIIGLLCSEAEDNCEQPLEAIEVEEVIIHPDYIQGPAYSLFHDVALVKLSRPSVINPVLIDLEGVSEEYTEGSELFLAGFGLTNLMNPTSPSVLQYADVPYYSTEDCTAAYGFTTDNFICTLASPKGACYGDSGGPLYDKDAGKLVGIFNVFGDQYCSGNGGPNLFARISSYSTWITNSVCKDHSSPLPTFCASLVPTPSPTPIVCDEEDIDLKVHVFTGDPFFGQPANIIAIFDKEIQFNEEDEPIILEQDLDSNSEYNLHYCLPCDQYYFAMVSLMIPNNGNYTLFVNDVETASGTPDTIADIEDDDSGLDLYVSIAPFSSSSCPTEAPTVSLSPTVSSPPTSSPTAVTASPTYTPCADDLVSFELNLRTDGYGEETSWNLTDSGGSLIAQSKGGLESETTYNYRECLEPCEIYTFTISDSYGDGLSGSPDAGYTVIVDGEVIKSSVSETFFVQIVEVVGGSDCAKPPMRIVLGEEMEDGTKMCIQPASDKLGATIVLKPCIKNRLLQGWTVDWMGQHHSLKSPDKCLKKGDGTMLILDECTDKFTKALATNFMFNQYFGTMHWMKNGKKALRYDLNKKKTVTLRNYVKPDAMAAKRQVWKIERF